MILDAYQSAAVELDAARVVSLAPAGAGKTRTLVARIARLLAAGVPAHEILAITFTRRAAREMKVRLEADGCDVEGLTVQTFHAWCAAIIRRHSRWLGLSASYTILGQDDAELLLRQVARDMGLEGERIETIWSRASKAHKADTLRRLYRQRLTSLDAIDYDGLETGMLALLRLDQIGPKVRSLYSHVLVDEYQDTSEGQAEILAALDPPHAFFVGDYAQAIYEWRGARPANILEALARSARADLRFNYRSTTAVVEAGNRLARYLGSPLDDVLVGRDDPDGGTVGRGLHATPEAAARAVAEGILAELDAGQTAPADILVLARTWRELYQVAEELRRLGIPTTVGKPEPEHDPWESPAMHVVVAALRCGENRRDELAVRKLLGWPENAVDEGLFARARGAAARTKRPFLDELLPLLGGTDDRLAYLESTTTEPVWEQAHRWARCSGMLDAPGVERAIGRIGEWAAQTVPLAVDRHAFLAWYALRTILPSEADEEVEQAVRLLTVHAAKGLEASVVHVLGCDQGHWPGPRDGGPGDPRFEEAKRLLYVAVTRARDAVYLHSAKERSTWGARTAAAGPSPFLAALRRS